jgi:tetratricopeptide (TPR) repeat protein
VAAAESVRSAARQRGTDAAAEAAGAVASVFVGDLTNAIEGLRRAAAASDDPRIQSDLSAVLLAQAERLGDATLVPDALRAADAAIASGRAPVEAYFNRALALEQLKRPDEAADAWAAYLDRDAASPWAAEARDHLRRLRG